MADPQKCEASNSEDSTAAAEKQNCDSKHVVLEYSCTIEFGDELANCAWDDWRRQHQQCGEDWETSQNRRSNEEDDIRVECILPPTIQSGKYCTVGK
ncbi:hypothetical protein NDU88_002433 [Pleurodeles waltl]|uniref:Uncharacterized protein n=1 Tax=Pleurodeles waltl TaxID=8319 RepID=A0AAV7T378_PLEWA|nr:hypothetical protein NDU88_002433 [Pleurodeles waltl]